MASPVPPLLPKQGGKEEESGNSHMFSAQKTGSWGWSDGGAGVSFLGYHLNQTAPGSPFLPWNQQDMPCPS